MSAATRQFVCDSFGQIDASQRADLIDDANEGAELDTHGTSTALIEFLSELFSLRDGVWRGKLMCTAVRSDHPSPDGPDGHQGGNAIDFAQIEDVADQHLIEDVQSCADARGIGLGGPYQNYATGCGGYDAGSELFQDNPSNHIHVQVVGY